jgi:hypothetical protein
MIELSPQKYNRDITLLCPTCGGSDFASKSDTDEVIQCARCKRELTKDDLVKANTENVAEHADEMVRELTEDIDKELRRALSGNQFFKIK